MARSHRNWVLNIGWVKVCLHVVSSLYQSLFIIITESAETIIVSLQIEQKCQYRVNHYLVKYTNECEQ